MTFRTQHGVAYGETVKVVGDSAYLGAWEIAAAPGALVLPSAKLPLYSACSLLATCGAQRRLLACHCPTLNDFRHTRRASCVLCFFVPFVLPVRVLVVLLQVCL